MSPSSTSITPRWREDMRRGNQWPAAWTGPETAPSRPRGGSSIAPMQPLIRLTAGQALVRYLASQWSERDGNRRRAIPGIFGIFGHGNVCGLGPALEEQEGRALAFHQPKNEQAMVHAAIGYARACNLLSTLACTASIGPGSTNLLTGAATATVNRVPALLLPSDTFAQRRGDPVMQALEHPREADLTGHTTELIAALAAVVIGGA